MFYSGCYCLIELFSFFRLQRIDSEMLGLSPRRVFSSSQLPKDKQLPRRNLLKPHSAANLKSVTYKEVSTPSQLSPIKKCPPEENPVYTDSSTLQLSEASAFHHFSVDASACLRKSQCDTIDASGVDLSRLSLECIEEEDVGVVDLDTTPVQREEPVMRVRKDPFRPPTMIEDSVALCELDTLEEWQICGEGEGTETCDSYVYYAGNLYPEKTQKDIQEYDKGDDSGRFTCASDPDSLQERSVPSTRSFASSGQGLSPQTDPNETFYDNVPTITPRKQNKPPSALNLSSTPRQNGYRYQ